MNLLEQFVDFLKNQKKKPSFTTIKNYKADIAQFVNWFEKEFNSLFDPSKVTSQIIFQYKKSRNLSPNSLQRHISSLRKFFYFLKTTEKINFSFFDIQETSQKIIPDPWMLRNFKSFLYDSSKSNLTIKNYINDIRSFFTWLTEVSLIKHAWNEEDKNLLDKVNFSVVDEYKQRLIDFKFSPRTINRKLSSLRNYINWASTLGIISLGEKVQSGISVPNIQKEFYAPLDISVNYLPTHKKIWHYMRYARPNWYKKYNAGSIVHFFYFAIIIVLISAVGFGLYKGFFADSQERTTANIISPLASGPNTLSINPINQSVPSPTKLIASSSAGKASIEPFQTEATIINTLVTDNSLIYITPVGTPSAQSPFLIRQVPQQSFTVGVQSPTKNPISFNWLIIN